MTKTISINQFRVKIYDTRAEMGFCAADEAAAAIRGVLAQKEECNMIFAAAPSQNEMLAALAAQPGIEWNRVNAFHMDEYIGLAPDAPQGFANFLRAAIFTKVPFRSVNCLDGTAASRDPAAECARYSQLLRRFPVDITCMGIGENGHIAFNDPPVADFDDPALVKPVALDEICLPRQHPAAPPRCDTVSGRGQRQPAVSLPRAGKGDGHERNSLLLRPAAGAF